MSILGVDLSITNTGLCILPDEWNEKPETLISCNIEKKKMGKWSHLYYEGLLDLIVQKVIDVAKFNDVDIVGIEQYAFSRNSRSASVLAEVCGHLRVSLFRDLGVVPVMIECTSARKTLMGHYRCKRKTDAAMGVKPLKIKDQVREFLKNRNFLLDGWDDNFVDAFAIAHYLYCSKQNISSLFEPARDEELISRR